MFEIADSQYRASMLPGSATCMHCTWDDRCGCHAMGACIQALADPHVRWAQAAVNVTTTKFNKTCIALCQWMVSSAVM
jgi:hypothetical protein